MKSKPTRCRMKTFSPESQNDGGPTLVCSCKYKQQKTQDSGLRSFYVSAEKHVVKEHSCNRRLAISQTWMSVCMSGCGVWESDVTSVVSTPDRPSSTGAVHSLLEIY